MNGNIYIHALEGSRAWYDGATLYFSSFTRFPVDWIMHNNKRLFTLENL